MLNILLLVLAVIFVCLDLVFSFFVKTVIPGSLFEGILKFFKDVNSKFIGLIDAVYNEFKANWHEFIIIWGIGIILMAINPLIFGFVLTGYLAFRLIQDLKG